MNPRPCILVDITNETEDQVHPYSSGVGRSIPLDTIPGTKEVKKVYQVAAGSSHAVAVAVIWRRSRGQATLQVRDEGKRLLAVGACIEGPPRGCGCEGGIVGILLCEAPVCAVMKPVATAWVHRRSKPLLCPKALVSPPSPLHSSAHACV